MHRGRIYRWFVKFVWARHNRAGPIRRALCDALSELDRSGRTSPRCSGPLGADLGSGAEALDPRLIRLDVSGQDRPDCLGRLEELPLRDGSLRLAVSQEVLEHLADPETALREVARVLEPGGLLYLQTPWVIGYHGSPRDYWRFTQDGLATLLARAGFTVERLEPSVASGTGLYRILVEYVAVGAGLITHQLYLPAKAAAAVLFTPLRWTDPLWARSPENHRIPGGFLALARKPQESKELALQPS